MKRSPMRRTGRLSWRSKKREEEAAERRIVVEFVKARDRRRCQANEAVPEVSCAGELDVHEVIPRSAWRAGYLEPTNCLTVCRAAHDWIHAEPLSAQCAGLLAPRWVLDRYGLAWVAEQTAELRYRLCCGDPTFAPWLTDSERATTPLPNIRWIHRAPLESW